MVTEIAATAKTGMRVETSADTEELFPVAVPEPALFVSTDDCGHFHIRYTYEAIGEILSL